MRIRVRLRANNILTQRHGVPSSTISVITSAWEQSWGKRFGQRSSPSYKSSRTLMLLSASLSHGCHAYLEERSASSTHFSNPVSQALFPVLGDFLQALKSPDYLSVVRGNLLS